MTGQRRFRPSRHHARVPVPVLSRLADWFRRRPGRPDGPALDLQDDGGGMDITDALETLEALEALPAAAWLPAATWLPAPTWDGATATAGNPLPALDRSYIPVPSEVIPFVPLTEEAVIWNALRGDEVTARRCGYCSVAQGRGDLSWRDDALGCWSCPACQMRPDWRAPALPGVRAATAADDAEWYGGAEMGILARSLLGTDPRCVRQRPDGRWAAAILVGGRRRVLGSFGSKEEAETVYGAILDAFAAGTEVAA